MATREPYSWSSRQGALLGHDGLTGSVPLPAVGPLVLFEKLFCPLASTAAEILVPEQRELRGPIGLVASAVAKSYHVCWMCQLAVDGMIHVSSGALQPVFYALIAQLGKVTDGEEITLALGSCIVHSRGSVLLLVSPHSSLSCFGLRPWQGSHAGTRGSIGKVLRALTEPPAHNEVYHVFLISTKRPSFVQAVS